MLLVRSRERSTAGARTRRLWPGLSFGNQECATSGSHNSEGSPEPMLNEAAKELHARSIAIVHALEKNIGRIILFWIAGAGLACAIRIAVAPDSSSLTEQLVRAAPYVLVVGA